MQKPKRLNLIKYAALALPCVFFSLQALAERPRVGLVLGGGGARGFAHVGVLKVLEENRIPVDCVVGTSIGSLVGAAYSAGRSPEEMQEKIVAADWDDLLSSTLPRQLNTFRRKQDDKYSLINVEFGLEDGQVKLPSAAISTQKIAFFLRDLTYSGTVSHFDELAIPYRAVATDLETGEMVVAKNGDLVTAMRASMAVPGVFPAVNTKGRMLVDGGLVRNLPVDVARETCADVVIAIDVGAAPLKRNEITNVLSIADQYTRLMMIQNVEPQIKSLTSKDILITPEFGALSSSDFKKGTELIAVGDAAARAILPQLQRYSVSELEYSAWSKQRKAKKLKPKVVKAIEIEQGNLTNPAVLQDALDVTINEPLNTNQFHENLMSVYAKGDYSQLDYELIMGPNGESVSVLPLEKSWGPNYLKFGLSFATDFTHSQPWNISAQYRRTWLNSLGAEWKNTLQVGSSIQFSTEFYQPLMLDETAFVSTYYRFFQGPLSIWNDNEQLAEYEYNKSSLGFDFGSILSNHSEFRLGPVFNKYEGNRSIGPEILPNFSGHDFGIRFNVFYDNLDNYFFPKDGSFLNAYGYYAFDVSDQSTDYARYGFLYRKAIGMEKDSIVFTAKAQSTYGTQPAFADVRWLGGFLNLSSYNYQELEGNQFIYGSAQYLYATNFLISGSYIGTALEIGSVFDNYNKELDDKIHYSASLYFAYDSFLGPL